MHRLEGGLLDLQIAQSLTLRYQISLAIFPVLPGRVEFRPYQIVSCADGPQRFLGLATLGLQQVQCFGHRRGIRRPLEFDRFFPFDVGLKARAFGDDRSEMCSDAVAIEFGNFLFVTVAGGLCGNPFFKRRPRLGDGLQAEAVEAGCE